MDNVFAAVESSTLGLLTLITGPSPARAARQLLPPLDLDLDMPVPAPNPIETQLKSPMTSSSGDETFPSAGPGAHDDRVLPPFHEARTLVLCFDGTGDQFDADVCAYMLPLSTRVLLADQTPFRIPISYSSSLC